MTPAARRPDSSGGGAPAGTMFGSGTGGAAEYTRPSGVTLTSESSAAGTSCSCWAPWPRLISNAP